MKGLKPLLSVLLLWCVGPLQAAPDAAAADNARTAPQERQQAALETLQQMPLEGEKLQLGPADKQAFALFQPALPGTAQGGVLLLHDRGSHVDAPGVIHPLRTGLPEAGWATLAVQLPPFEKELLTAEWLDQAQATIAAALNELQNRGISNIVLLGHGLGALAASDYLAAGDNLTVRGLVVVGMDGSSHEEPRLDGAARLATVRPPILDIFGGRDARAVLNSAERRAMAARRRDGSDESAHTLYRDIARNYSERKGDGVGYRQIRIAPADHNFTRQNELLVRRVRGWLKRHVADMEIEKQSN